jgi:L-ascorbate metabolism protein UlaG (beta-lactamase superfamily)
LAARPWEVLEVNITWLAHAAFLIEGDGLRIITDPYTPETMGFAVITEPADIVLRSSSDDLAHCNAEMIRGNPVVITATEVDPAGIDARGVHFTAIPAQESLIYKAAPGDNALYRFTLEGIRVGHFGDVGNRLTPAQLEALAGVDVLLVPAGGRPTIELDDLVDAIDALQPRVVIPMHYQLPGASFKMLPVTDFASRWSADRVVWHNSSTLTLTAATLPSQRQLHVMAPSTAHASPAP